MPEGESAGSKSDRTARSFDAGERGGRETSSRGAGQNTSTKSEGPRLFRPFSWLARPKPGSILPLSGPAIAQVDNEDARDNSGVLGHAARRASPRADMRLKIEAFENARVDDVMVPRAEIVALEVSTRLEDVLKLFAEAAHSRLPLYRETLDDPIGMVHIKDVVAELSSRDDWPQDERLLPGLRRDILFVPASMRLTDLLVKMQSTRIHLALVVDEYGGTDGLVSIEDLVEQIVGEIEDEHDEELALIVRRGRGLWEADAKAELDEVEAETGFSLMLEDFEDEVDTLGGIVIALAGRVPQRGEIVPHPAGFDLEVLDADPRRIKRLRLRQTVLPEAPPAVMTTKGATG